MRAPPGHFEGRALLLRAVGRSRRTERARPPDFTPADTKALRFSKCARTVALRFPSKFDSLLAEFARPAQ